MLSLVDKGGGAMHASPNKIVCITIFSLAFFALHKHNTMSPNLLLHDVLAANLQAIHLMQAGDGRGATVGFYKCLNQVKTLMASAWQEQEEEPQQDNDPLVMEALPLLVPPSSSLHQDTASFAVWTQFFVLFPPNNDITTTQPCLGHWQLVTAVLTYNFALAQHLAGSLRQAGRLYALTQQMLQSQNNDDDTVPLSMQLFVLAVANNQAALALQAMDYATVQACRRTMARQLTGRSRTDTSFFAANLTASSQPEARPAAAA